MAIGLVADWPKPCESSSASSAPVLKCEVQLECPAGEGHGLPSGVKS